MVHALREIWRVLTPHGALIDLRPLHIGWRIDVVTDEKIILVEDDIEDGQYIPKDVSSERALEQAQTEGWFARESLTQFEHHRYWQEVDAMIAFWADKSPPLYFADDVLERARALLVAEDDGAQIRVVNPVIIGLFPQVVKIEDTLRCIRISG